MKHHFKVGDHVLSYNSLTQETVYYDVVAVMGDQVTLLGQNTSKQKAERLVFIMKGPRTLASRHPDESLDLIRGPS